MSQAAKKTQLSDDEMEVASDLRKKVVDDVGSAIARPLNLCDDYTSRVYIATGGTYAASIALAVLMNAPDTPKPDDAGIVDRMLFAALFSHHIDAEIAKKKAGAEVALDLHSTVKAARKSWEAVTGRTFDPSWLVKGIADHAR